MNEWKGNEMEYQAVEVPKFDGKDYGPMGDYEDPNKPECPKCFDTVFVVATGRNGDWHWSCTKCVTEQRP
jgi:ribosomal protein S27AE